MGIITTIGSAIIGGVTQYQVAKASQPNNPYIPDLLEYGITGPPEATTTGVVTIDNATGEVISCKKMKRRRRRRRLATASDLKDLAALKAILGGGKSLDTWVATRGR